jgi:hypothetical protein
MACCRSFRQKSRNVSPKYICKKCVTLSTEYNSTPEDYANTVTISNLAVEVAVLHYTRFG